MCLRIYIHLQSFQERPRTLVAGLRDNKAAALRLRKTSSTRKPAAIPALAFAKIDRDPPLRSASSCLFTDGMGCHANNGRHSGRLGGQQGRGLRNQLVAGTTILLLLHITHLSGVHAYTCDSTEPCVIALGGVFEVNKPCSPPSSPRLTLFPGLASLPPSLSSLGRVSPSLFRSHVRAWILPRAPCVTQIEHETNADGSGSTAGEPCGDILYVWPLPCFLAAVPPCLLPHAWPPCLRR